MKQGSFSDLAHKLQLLNPEANIGYSSKTDKIIWSEVPADQLVLPPNIGSVEGNSILILGGNNIQVKLHGE